MKCPRCHASNRQQAKFCRVCGDTLKVACPSCGAACPAGGRYCDGCGFAIPRTGILSATRSRFNSPIGYTPPHLAERIVSSRAVIEGERKQVTVLFADLAGSLALVAGRDPEDARALLDAVLEQMIGAVHAFDGIVNHVMGDGVMALFGAPVALEDHAVRAGLAALRMLESIAYPTSKGQSTGDSPLKIRVGINSGEVLVRSIGTELHMDYTAVGQTTHVAARLEQLAQPGTALCAVSTLRLAEGYFRVRAQRFVSVKGLTEPIEVAELAGLETARMRFHVAAARGLTPFVGRQAERGAIARALRRVAEGRGQVISLIGEPGIGKSRLIWESARSNALRDWLVIESGGASYGAGMPYLPIRRLMQAYFGISVGEPTERARERVRERLGSFGAGLAGAEAPILALLDMPFEDERWSALEPAQCRREIDEAVRSVLFCESEARPVLVVVEDLHWTDRETEGFLEAFAERLGSLPIALMVNARPEYRQEWSAKTSCLLMRVDPLAPDQSKAMIAALLGSADDLTDLATTLAERTGGNPFFIEESVRTLVEGGAITGKPGCYRSAQPFAGALIPPSVQAVIAARIDRLALEDKRLLQAIAAIGLVVPVSVLGAAVRLPAPTLLASLARLRDAGFVFESRVFPEPEYSFAHALTREVAYGGMLKEQRRHMHAEIVKAIEHTYSGRLEQHVENLAYHAFHGGAWEKTVTWARSAAAKAASRSAYQEALSYLDQALQAVSNLPARSELLAIEIDLRIEMRAVLYPLGEIVRDLANLNTAVAVAEKLGDPRRLATLLAMQTRDLSILGHARRAVECGTRAAQLAEQLGDPDLTVLANAHLGAVYVARGDYREAVKILTRGIAAFRGSNALARFGLPAPAAVILRVWLVTALTRLGEFEEATREVTASIAAAAKSEQPLAMLVARYTNGFLLANEGRLPDAIVELEQSMELCTRWRLPAWFSNIASILGWAYARSGRTGEGITLMREAIDASVKGGGMVNHSSEVVRLAEVLFLSGDAAQSRSLAEHALELARHYEERGNEAIAAGLLGEIWRQSSPFDPVGEMYRHHAIDIAASLGMAPEFATTRRGSSQWPAPTL